MMFLSRYVRRTNYLLGAELRTGRLLINFCTKNFSRPQENRTKINSNEYSENVNCDKDDFRSQNCTASDYTNNFPTAEYGPSGKHSNQTEDSREDIISRLRRLSVSSAENFVPTHDPEAIIKMKQKFSSTLKAYERRFRKLEETRRRNPNYFGGKMSRHGNERWFSTSAGFRGSASDPEVSKSTFNDADVFGTLSLGNSKVKDKSSLEKKEDLINDNLELGLSAFDEFDEDDLKFTPEHGEKWTMRKLRIAIKDLVKERKVKEAVDTLMDALEKGGFQYDKRDFEYIYGLCIYGCSSVGYVKMAFKLFNDMKNRGFTPKMNIYTSLFNTCAKSTWDAENNVERMNKLREIMAEKGIQPNEAVFHSMIKGYGRCGALSAAFAVVDEMLTVSPSVEITAVTFNMLLQACITDQENGFRHVIVTWRKMLSMNIRPDIYSFNLLLRAIRECSVQPDEKLLLAQRKNKKILEHSKKQHPPMLPNVISQGESDKMLSMICLYDSDDKLEKIPNEISEYLQIMDSLKVPQNRLAMFGGLRGIIQVFSQYVVGPNLKTVTELAQVINPAEAIDLLSVMKMYKLTPDITFFNLLLKQCYCLGNPRAGSQITAAMAEFNLHPNILTWGASATGCYTLKVAKKLLHEMDNSKFLPNIQIMGALLHNACQTSDIQYVMWVMKELQRRRISPCPKFVLELENFKLSVKKDVIKKETGKPLSSETREMLMDDKDKFDADWKEFLVFHDVWMRRVKVAIEPKDPFNKDYRNFTKYKRHNIENLKTLSMQD